MFNYTSVAQMKLQTLKIGQVVSTQGYTTPNDGGGAQYLIVAGGTGTDDGGSYIDLAGGQQAELVIKNKTIDAAAFGAKLDNVADDLIPFQNAAAYCLANGATLVWTGVAFFSADITLRNFAINAPRGLIRVESPNKIVLGGNSNARTAPKVTIERVFRSVIDTAFPEVQIRGAKGAIIELQGETEYVQLFADTNSDVVLTDTSIAYCQFYFTRVVKIEITNNPTTDGTSVQWINENAFYLKRTNEILVNGTYQHSHNVFYVPNIEAASTLLVDFQTGASNRIYDARLEGLSAATFNFSTGTWNNKIISSWMNHPVNTPTTSPSVIVTDDGVQNEVIFDFNMSMRSSLIGERSAHTTMTNFRTGVYFVAVPSLLNQYSSTNSNGVLVQTRLIPVVKNDIIKYSANSDITTAFSRAVLRCYDSRLKPVTISTADVVSGLLTAYSGNTLAVTTGIQNGAQVTFLSDLIEYVTFEVTSSFGNQFNNPTAVYINLWRMQSSSLTLPLTSSEINSAPTILVTAKPTQVIAEEGQLISDGTTIWTVVFAHRTNLSGSFAAAATVITVDNAGTAAVGDLIGVGLDSGLMHWTTITNVAANVLTLNTGLPTIATDMPVQISRLSP